MIWSTIAVLFAISSANANPDEAPAASHGAHSHHAEAPGEPSEVDQAPPTSFAGLIDRMKREVDGVDLANRSENWTAIGETARRLEGLAELAPDLLGDSAQPVLFSAVTGVKNYGLGLGASAEAHDAKGVSAAVVQLRFAISDLRKASGRPALFSPSRQPAPAGGSDHGGSGHSH